MTSERLDFDELDQVRAYIRERDECAMKIGVFWLEFESLRAMCHRRVHESLRQEKIFVNELAKRHGAEGEDFRVDLETGEIHRVR